MKTMRIQPFDCPNCGHGILLDELRCTDENQQAIVYEVAKMFDNALFDNPDSYEPRWAQRTSRQDLIRAVFELWQQNEKFYGLMSRRHRKEHKVAHPISWS